MKFNLSITAFLILIFMTTANAKDKYFNDAILLYEKEKYEESKFLFQKNIVFNPKDFKSYYYLAKIFQIHTQMILKNNQLIKYKIKYKTKKM